MKVKLNRVIDPPGYMGYSTYSWDCTMCDESFWPNLEKKYVRNAIARHLMRQHRVMSHKIEFKVRKGVV